MKPAPLTDEEAQLLAEVEHDWDDAKFELVAALVIGVLMVVAFLWWPA